MISVAAAPPSFQDSLAALARGEQADLSHLLPSYELPVSLPGTKTTVRTHFVAVDANGEPAIDMLADVMAFAAMEFCVPRTRLVQAAKSFADTGSPSQFARLEKQARELFVDADGTGEGGELLLFLLMERVLKLPQLLAKMSLKTNSNVHVHGSDGVHARLGSDGVLELSWGESKLYKSNSDAIADCFGSIAPFLGAVDDARRRDLLLVRDNLNVDDEALAAHILQYFDETNPKVLDVRWNGACLIGFDYATYPDLKKMADDESQQIAKAVERWHKSVSGRLTTHSLVDVAIDVFCIPFPSVDALRKSVRKSLGLL
ncbi:DUF1837 domain-containing protein [Frigoribacterium sp. 9N]|uniref:HamA C-terminal domain-containing protein n=1 Tax=Frigoribacterium sp. 9N TaxID=2653144 RepID=UPI0012F46D7D|nr:DUF1837 domain-containing protein [Frigoribacterium sp. 9N]VXB93485.1 conserved hypothetical protein [Frigoribacterium sp. 9N]